MIKSTTKIDFRLLNIVLIGIPHLDATNIDKMLVTIIFNDLLSSVKTYTMGFI